MIDPEERGVFQRPDYFETLARLRADDPVHEYRPGSWLLTRYAEVREVSGDPARFCSSQGVLMDDPLRRGRPLPGSVLHMDPPEHAPWRKLVSRSFTPRALAAFEARLRRYAAEVLDPLAPGDQIDWVAEVAAPFPVLAIADLLGIADGDRDDFRRWSDACIEGGGDDESLRSVLELIDFLGAHADARRAQPSEDVVSHLTEGEIDGCPVPRDAVVQYAMALLVAGNETTRHLLSGTVAALSDHPDQRAQLAATPDGIALAVEEALRWITPIQTFGRTATEATELGGQRIAAGDWVAMSYASANRDEAVFGPDADRFDTARPVPPTHLAFGFGEHLCLGASLARLEARVLLEELLARFPAVDVAGAPTWVSSTLVRGMHTLPVAVG